MKQLENIPKTMKALLCCGPHDYRYQDAPVPSVGEDEILVKVEACGICAGDIKSYNGAAMFWGGGVLPPWNDAPCVAGHEFIGTVAAAILFLSCPESNMITGENFVIDGGFTIK